MSTTTYPKDPAAIEFSFDSIPFLDGAYDLVVGIQSKLGGVQYDWQEPAAEFEVINPGKAVGFISIPHHVAMVSAVVRGPLEPGPGGLIDGLFPSHGPRSSRAARLLTHG